MAVNFSHGMARLSPEDRRASKNKRIGKERRASTEAFEIHAERPAVLPWASPAKARIPVTGRDRRKVIKRLQRDGWDVTTVRARKGWLW